MDKGQRAVIEAAVEQGWELVVTKKGSSSARRMAWPSSGCMEPRATRTRYD